jgi:hypothetical protein
MFCSFLDSRFCEKTSLEIFWRKGRRRETDWSSLSGSWQVEGSRNHGESAYFVWYWYADSETDADRNTDTDTFRLILIPAHVSTDTDTDTFLSNTDTNTYYFRVCRI